MGLAATPGASVRARCKNNYSSTVVQVSVQLLPINFFFFKTTHVANQIGNVVAEILFCFIFQL